ncbi:phytochrome A-associated F-box protein [Punica granatum]|uniref:Uncharacterized protein n=2 Tax=Punica granatum TaxID=22663 RepID=A0A2I0KXD5_PUNGR|nr:phytochrome A-associated F-box protein [Punica granatum]PKI73000.1 hypothetical protein CRG98_006603 [Punica granatum]
MAETVFGRLSDDVVLKIFSKLEEDPRNWARLACVCTKFSSLIRTVCWKAKCSATIPSVASDLLGSSSPPSAWSSLFKLAVCCPDLLHAGVLLEHSDFGLERELGPDDDFPRSSSSAAGNAQVHERNPESSAAVAPASSGSDCAWSLFDDLYFDTVYNAAETSQDGHQIEEAPDRGTVRAGRESSSSPFKRRKICRSMRAHLASGVWNLSREQGNKLLASRFRGDCLYICDWPGCVHIEEKRNYMLFRGVFKNFKRSRVWRTINDGNRNKLDLNCAFCSCKETWDLHSAFCLRRGLGYHDDGEPVVRAYVCENGHVSGAWTDLPLYT